MKNLIQCLLLCLAIIAPLNSKLIASSDNQSALNLAELDNLRPALKVAELIKRSIPEWSSAEIQHQMQRHYLILRLIDKDGRWKAPELEKISLNLLPDNLTRQNVMDFVDKIAALAEKNPYLQAFLMQANETSFPLLEEKLSSEGAVVLPDVVAFALVMERLAIAMKSDWRILEISEKIWKVERKKANISQYMTLFEKAKLYSVEYCMDQFVKYNQTSKVSPHFLKIMLPVNILEAMLEDLHHGLEDNARAGWTLTINKPGSGCDDKANGCPARWSSDGKAILISMPEPQKWADLYQTWNLAFVTNYPNFPYFFVKLLIPQVADYQSSPEEYILNRGVSLYTFIHYELLDRADRLSQGDAVINWHDEELSKLWGEANLSSAMRYEGALKRQSPSWKAKLEKFEEEYQKSWISKDRKAEDDVWQQYK